MTHLDADFVRAQFPAFTHPETGQWAHLENAGGSYVPRQVISRLEGFFTASKVQPYWDFGPSRTAGEAMDTSKARMPATFNAAPGEVHFGPSTTQNTYVLAHALRAGMVDGDEVIVTNQDHEANVGAWRRLETTGIAVKEWSVDTSTGMLHLDALEALLTDRTRLVAVTHASNVAATINPIAAVAERTHAAGGIVVVDGVAYAPHAAIDVRALDCDVYLYSAYKTYGPHVGMMYVGQKHLDQIANQGHYFNESNTSSRLVPAGPNHAEIAATGGVMAYYDTIHAHHFDHAPTDDVTMVREVFELFAAYEQTLMAPLVRYIVGHPDLNIVGTPSSAHVDRTPTIAFHTDRMASSAIYHAMIAAKVSCGHGHFYAHRLITALGLDPDDGVIRLSLVHYNTATEVDRALEVLESVLN